MKIYFNGQRVQDSRGNFGTIIGEPALTASGEVVTVEYEEVGITASGGADILLSDLWREDGHPLTAKPEDGLNGGLDKARDFEALALNRGWSALARTGHGYGVALVTAEKGDTRIVLKWYEGKFGYYASAVETLDEKRRVVKSRKIRNVSAARKLLDA